MPSWGRTECLNPCSAVGAPSALFSQLQGLNDSVDGKCRPLAHRSDVRDKGGGEGGAPSYLVRGGPDSLGVTRFVLSAPPLVQMI